MSYLPPIPPVVPPNAELGAEWVKRYMSDQSQFRDVLRKWIVSANACCDTNTTNIASLTTDLAALDAVVDALVALGLSVPVPIAKGGTGQTGQTAAFDALAPTTTKGDLIASNGTDNVRVAVGTDGYPLIADAASSAGVKWATTQETVTWWVTFANRPYTGAAAASPPTLAAADGTLQDSTSASASAGRNMTDANVTWHMVQFCVPDELDVTQAVNARVYFRLASNAGSGEQVEFTTRLRASFRDELVVSAGTFREVSGTIVLTGYSAGDLGICTISGALAANDLSTDDFVHGVLERNATAGNANDTYPATVNVYAIRFVGKRKVRS